MSNLKIENNGAIGFLVKKRKAIAFLLYYITIWTPLSLFLSVILTVWLDPSILEQPTSYGYQFDPDLGYAYDPADALFVYSAIFCQFIIPLIIFLVHLLIRKLTFRLKLNYFYGLLFLSYMISTFFTMISAAILSLNLYHLFTNMIYGIIVIHTLSYRLRDIVNANFYKAIEYIYVISAVVGLLSVSEPLELAHKTKVTILEKRISSAKQSYRDRECTGNHYSDECLDYERLDELKDELKTLLSSKPKKINFRIKMIGYVLVTIAINLKLLKISAELFRWHKK